MFCLFLWKSTFLHRRHSNLYTNVQFFPHWKIGERIPWERRNYSFPHIHSFSLSVSLNVCISDLHVSSHDKASVCPWQWDGMRGYLRFMWTSSLSCRLIWFHQASHNAVPSCSSPFLAFRTTLASVWCGWLPPLYVLEEGGWMGGLCLSILKRWDMFHHWHLDRIPDLMLWFLLLRAQA